MHQIELIDAKSKPITKKQMQYVVDNLPWYLWGRHNRLFSGEGWILCCAVTLHVNIITISIDIESDPMQVSLAVDLAFRFQQTLREFGLDMVATSKFYELGDYKK